MSLFNLLPENILTLGERKYQLLGEPVSGGSSLVYKVRTVDGVFRDFYMIKELYPHELVFERKPVGTVNFLQEKEEQVALRKERARRESEIANALRYSSDDNHPLFLSYSDPIRANNTLYTIIATESGDMLSNRIDHGYFRGKRFEEICDVVLRILDALEPVHEKGYLHLDVSPDNIHFSDSGIARLIDYNSAVCLNSPTEKVVFSIKQGYSAPELYEHSDTKPAHIGFATDLLSVTAIFFEMLCDRRLIEKDWALPKRWYLSSEEGYLQGASTLLVDKTNAFLQKGISLTPRKRFQSAADMRASLEELKRLRIELQLENNRKQPYAHFVGRESEIKQIDTQFSQNTYVFLEGIGGIGKSELAKRYAWQYRKKYNIIQFITYNESLLSTIATSLRLRDFDQLQYEKDYKKEEVFERIFEDKMTCLQRYNEKTLIIVDNYNVAADDHFHRFVSGDYRVIFTSREKHSGNVIEVAPMECGSDLMALFLEYYGPNKPKPEDEAVIRKMIDLVLGHTMTIMLIAAAMKTHEMKPSQMLEKLWASFDPGLEKAIPVDKEEISVTVREQVMYQHVLNLFDMETFSEKSTEQEHCRDIMTNLAIAPYHGLEIDKFCEWTLLDEQDALDKLIRLRWVQFDSDTRTVSLHPVISDVANTRLLPDSEKCLDLLLALVDFSDEFLDLPDEDEKKTYIEAKKTANILELSCKRICDETGYAAILHTNFADTLEFLGEFERVLESREKAVRFSETDPGESHPLTVQMYLALSGAYRPLGRYAEMLPWLYKALQAEQSHRNDISASAGIYARIGQVYEWTGDYNQALKWCEEALALYEKTPEQNPLQISLTYFCMGTVYYWLENYREAIFWHKKVLKIREELLGPKHRHTIESYTIIAMAYGHLEGDPEAMQWLQKARAAWETTPDKEPAGTANVYNLIGHIHREQKDSEGALKWYKKAVVIQEEVLGLKHPYTIESYGYITKLYLGLGDMQKAQEWFTKVSPKS